MQQQPYDWREEPRRLSVSSLILLVIFVGAVAAVVYVAFQMKPWESDQPVTAEVANATEVPAAGEVTPVASPAPVP
jgi:uncharacterized membrane protein